ncbi:MAG: tripartite tricarboxylate transporter substrate binding protein [Polaromonas sp.]|uniref:Bug family tripartite tricarboxylate transporter substrate binding protein n=1 Tax=Polaromonas sp. TaxID=1869339 RepID=UPI002732A4EA|nr:tripartite tricarboxylate transporter substrate binding protein [Polaromonas sp.]MDP3799028.1 tripartite tricarboxylate transporter substrate binding protein [Polaromonas sp.]
MKIKLKANFKFPGLAVLAMSLFSAAAGAQDFPNKPIHIVVPFAPGGGTDVLTRILAQQVSEEFKQQVVVDNKPGAGGALGAGIVAKAPADGYTLYVASTATAMMPSLYKNLGFDPIADFAPIALIGTSPFILIATNSLPAKTLPEMIALAKAKPGTLSYGSAGTGSVNHVTMELFKVMAGVDILHVPYKGSSAALADVIGGQVSMMMDTVISATQQVKSNTVRALASTSAERSPLSPDLPTISELGPKGYGATVWYGLVAPKGIPDAVAQKLNMQFNKALGSPAVRQRFATLGAEPVFSTTADFGKLIVSEEKKWTGIIKGANIRAE